MNNNINLVTDALEYYDKNTEKHKDLFKHCNFVKFIPAANEFDHNFVVFYDSD